MDLFFIVILDVKVKVVFSVNIFKGKINVIFIIWFFFLFIDIGYWD